MQKNMALAYLLALVWVSASTVNAEVQALRKDPLLVCALMIKNEAPVIEKTLTPMVDGGIDSFLIYDTGSTDDTIATVHTFFAAKGITNYVIEQEPFADFATSRNKALDFVDQHFPQATFILMPDAEWLLRNGKSLLAFCENHKEDKCSSYMVRMFRNGGLEYDVDRLIRRSSHARFKSPVHEYLESPIVGKLPAEAYFYWESTKYGDDKSHIRWQRDAKILLKHLAEEPTNSRTAFYLAQTYACLGEWEEAIRFYQLRVKLVSWDEENFMTLYRLGEAVERFITTDTGKASIYTWSTALLYYMKAYAMRPTRIEPLIRIAQHYLHEGNHAVAYLFAKRAAEMPYPTHDTLFVEKTMYTHTCFDILGHCAWYIGEFEAGKQALQKALEYNPDDKHLLENLRFYEERESHRCCG